MCVCVASVLCRYSTHKCTHTHTHTHTQMSLSLSLYSTHYTSMHAYYRSSDHIGTNDRIYLYMYIYMCVCVCVCVYRDSTTSSSSSTSSRRRLLDTGMGIDCETEHAFIENSQGSSLFFCLLSLMSPFLSFSLSLSLSPSLSLALFAHLRSLVSSLPFSLSMSSYKYKFQSYLLRLPSDACMFFFVIHPPFTGRRKKTKYRTVQ